MFGQMEGWMDRQTDGQTNGQTEWTKTIYPLGILCMPAYFVSRRFNKLVKLMML